MWGKIARFSVHLMPCRVSPLISLNAGLRANQAEKFFLVCVEFCSAACTVVVRSLNKMGAKMQHKRLFDSFFRVTVICKITELNKWPKALKVRGLLGEGAQAGPRANLIVSPCVLASFLSPRFLPYLFSLSFANLRPTPGSGGAAAIKKSSSSSTSDVVTYKEYEKRRGYWTPS